MLRKPPRKAKVIVLRIAFKRQQYADPVAEEISKFLYETFNGEEDDATEIRRITWDVVQD